MKKNCCNCIYKVVSACLYAYKKNVYIHWIYRFDIEIQKSGTNLEHRAYDQVSLGVYNIKRVAYTLFPFPRFTSASGSYISRAARHAARL